MELPHAQFLSELVQHHSSATTKLTWDELCGRIEARVPSPPKQNHNDNGGNTDGNGDLYMSRQVLARMSSYVVHNPRLNKVLLSVLRHEDAIHIPLLQVDQPTGTITDWNRAMADLSGVSKADVVGKTYECLLSEWAPHLSEEYRASSVDWIGREKYEPMAGDYFDQKDETKLRGHYLFPLPLPIKHETGKGNNDDCWYIELLACRIGKEAKDMVFSDVYSCHMFSEGEMTDWNAKTTRRWIGGPEFTLRRKHVLPSPRSVAGGIDGDGSTMTFNDVVSEKPAPSDAAKATGLLPPGWKADPYGSIAEYIRSCSAEGIEYFREVLYHVRMSMRKRIVDPKKAYKFTKDWTSVIETAEINKVVLMMLGGDPILEQSVTGGKLTWRLAFSSSYSKKNKDQHYELECKRRQWDRLWQKFLATISPVVGESVHSRSICAATDVPSVIPFIAHPERTLLTLKIEGVERTCGSDLEEKFKAWATVQVPASLNFFQLHRVIIQTMNCSNYCTRETHLWKIQNIAPELDSSGGQYGHLDLIQLGDTYFVENGVKASFNEDYSLFGEGGAIRQRISRTAAHYDQMPPLYYDQFSSDFGYKQSSVGKISACIHSTSIGAAFYQPGVSATLEEGLVKYSTTYKITCTRVDEYKGPMPSNPNINVMLPKCIRGKNEDDHHTAHEWSVANANAQIEKDRGCLRRNLIGAHEGMSVIPWCWSGDYRFGAYDPSEPLAAQLKGTDLCPMSLTGEPALPNGSATYSKYVASLEGRIDPGFLQENVIHDFMSCFDVPFKMGKPGKGLYGFNSCDEAQKSVVDTEPVLGVIWEKEVDEETKRMGSLQPKEQAKSKGKKRKAGTSA